MRACRGPGLRRRLPQPAPGAPGKTAPWPCVFHCLTLSFTAFALCIPLPPRLRQRLSLGSSGAGPSGQAVAGSSPGGRAHEDRCCPAPGPGPFSTAFPLPFRCHFAAFSLPCRCLSAAISLPFVAAAFSLPLVDLPLSFRRSASSQVRRPSSHRSHRSAGVLDGASDLGDRSSAGCKR